jgi:hypothetical protein
LKTINFNYFENEFPLLLNIAEAAEEIYSKFESNGPYYITSIANILKILATSEEEFYRFTFRNYFEEKDFNKRPLSKLDKDIYMKMKSIISVS